VPEVMVDETEEGNLFAALRTREADLTAHLNNGQDKAVDKPDAATIKAREEAREKARQRLEEETRKNPGQRLMPEYGSDKDFQLRQALNRLKGQPVVVSKTLTERTEEKPDTN
jgi:carboxyl-terminal processing protease